MSKRKRKRTPAEIAADAKRTGRPPLPRRQRRELVISVRMTREEHRRWRKEAKRRGLPLGIMLLKPWREGKA